LGVRIFTLAKELDMTSKELISFLKTQGHKVASHMSSIDDPVAKILRDRLKPKVAEAPAEKPKASPTAAKGGESKTAGTATKKAPATAAGKKRKRSGVSSRPMNTVQAAPGVSQEKAGVLTAEAAEATRLNEENRLNSKLPRRLRSLYPWP